MSARRPRTPRRGARRGRHDDRDVADRERADAVHGRDPVHVVLLGDPLADLAQPVQGAVGCGGVVQPGHVPCRRRGRAPGPRRASGRRRRRRRARRPPRRRRAGVSRMSTRRTASAHAPVDMARGLARRLAAHAYRWRHDDNPGDTPDETGDPDERPEPVQGHALRAALRRGRAAAASAGCRLAGRRHARPRPRCSARSSR